jgi:hypothetical protein
MQQDINRIIDRAFEIAAEPSALYVAVTVRRWHRQRKDFVFVADRESLTRDLETVLRHRGRTVIGFLIIQGNSYEFETLGDVTEREARRAILDYDWSRLDFADLRALVQP